MTTSYGAAPVDLEAALALIAYQKINVKDTITQTLPLSQIQAGFKIVAEAKESLKVVLEPVGTGFAVASPRTQDVHA